MAAKQKKGQKYDRNRKRSSGASQAFRTAANKTKKIKRALKNKERAKAKWESGKRTPRGTARRKARASLAGNQP